MKARFRRWIAPLIGLSLISIAVAIEWLFNRPSVFVKYDPYPSIVFDDIHALQIDLIVFQGYGPSRYSGGYTELGFGGHTLCTVPFSSFTVLFFIVGVVTFVVASSCKRLHYGTVAG